jgi:PAS domain S-box-containing protein
MLCFNQPGDSYLIASAQISKRIGEADFTYFSSRASMNQYLANIIDAANEGIYVTDRDRRFLLWNRAAEKIAGYRKEEIIGRHCHDNILSHIDREGQQLCLAHCPLQAAIEDGTPHGPQIVYLRHKDGRRIAVEVKTAAIEGEDGSIVGGVEVFQDVTQRLEQERLLRERKEKLETVLDNIGDGILFLDTGGNISVVNRVCSERLGLARTPMNRVLSALSEDAPIRQAFSTVEGEYGQSMRFAVDRVPAGCPEGKTRFRCWTAIIGRSPFGHRSPCYTCTTFRQVRAFLEKPHEIMHGECTFTVVSSFIEFPETNDLWEIVVFHDVTPEKLDAALKVAGAAAHELRQPLQVIMALASLLEKALGDHKEVRNYLDSLQRSCDRMDHIIRQMSAIIRYRTKEYVGGKNILDIERSADSR